MHRVAGFMPGKTHARERATGVPGRGGQHRLFRFEGAQVFQRMKRLRLRRRHLEIEHQLAQRQRVAVGVLHLRQLRIGEAIGDLVKQRDQLKIIGAQHGRRDPRIPGGNKAAHFHDARLFPRREHQSAAGFKHGQMVDRRELREHQIATLDGLRRGVLGDHTFLARHHIAQGKLPAGFALHHLIERQGFGERRFEVTAQQRIEAAPPGSEIGRGGNHVVQ